MYRPSNLIKHGKSKGTVVVLLPIQEQHPVGGIFLNDLMLDIMLCVHVGGCCQETMGGAAASHKGPDSTARVMLKFWKQEFSDPGSRALGTWVHSLNLPLRAE